MPSELANIKAVVLAGAHVHVGLFQHLLYSAELSLGVIRITGDDDTLSGHARGAQEEHIVVCRGRGHLATANNKSS